MSLHAAAAAASHSAARPPCSHRVSDRDESDEAKARHLHAEDFLGDELEPPPPAAATAASAQLRFRASPRFVSPEGSPDAGPEDWDEAMTPRQAEWKDIEATLEQLRADDERVFFDLDFDPEAAAALEEQEELEAERAAAEAEELEDDPAWSHLMHQPLSNDDDGGIEPRTGHRKRGRDDAVPADEAVSIRAEPMERDDDEEEAIALVAASPADQSALHASKRARSSRGASTAAAAAAAASSSAVHALPHMLRFEHSKQQREATSRAGAAFAGSGPTAAVAAAAAASSVSSHSRSVAAPSAPPLFVESMLCLEEPVQTSHSYAAQWFRDEHGDLQCSLCFAPACEPPNLKCGQ